MTYRNDFYKKENIIGYTGDLNQKPTVYFQKAHTYNPGLISFGRITQAHADDQNVGREFVFKAKHYSARNERVHGTRTLVERVNDQLIHTSRNPMILVDQKNTNVIDQLAESIDKYPELKPRYEDHLQMGRIEPSQAERFQRELDLLSLQPAPALDLNKFKQVDQQLTRHQTSPQKSPSIEKQKKTKIGKGQGI